MMTAHRDGLEPDSVWISPLYNAMNPSSFTMVGNAETALLYLITLPNSPCNCIRTLTTSIGTVANSAAQIVCESGAGGQQLLMIELDGLKTE